MSSPQDSAAERLRERLDGQSDFAALLGGGAPKAVPQVSVPAPYLRLVLDEYAERGRKAAAFDALVEAVERVRELKTCHPFHTAAAANAAIHDRLETALASAKEAVGDQA